MQIKEALNEGKKILKQNNIEDSSMQTRILMQYILKKSYSYIIANLEESLDNEKQEEFMMQINKIVEGVPIQYITNEQEFMKLKFYVDENVLIPQPDTEILVEEVIKDYYERKVKILDLCTGSGAIGISLAKFIKKSNIVATDISGKALQIAKMNAENLQCSQKVKFILSDMFNNIDKEKFDIIVSNPPYIKTNIINTLDKTVQNEPIIALDGGACGLKFYTVIAENAYKFLNNNGKLYLEIGYDQKNAVISLLEKTSYYTEIICKQDLAGNDRVIIAKKR